MSESVFGSLEFSSDFDHKVDNIIFISFVYSSYWLY